jgi:photosystem II stability/assembly factor-like uncharacterized protein
MIFSPIVITHPSGFLVSGNNKPGETFLGNDAQPSNLVSFPFAPHLSNLSLGIQAGSTVWISTVYANSNSFLLGGSSGLIGVDVNGSINKMTTFPQGTQPLMVDVNDSFVAVGAGVMTNGGIETFRYTPVNLDLQSDYFNLPYSWTFPGNGTYFATFSYGNGYYFMIERTINTSQPYEVVLYHNGQLVNITSSFSGTPNGQFASAYGDGYFLLLTQDKDFLYNISTQKAVTIPGVTAAQFPLYTNIVTWNGTAFIFQNGTTIASLNPSNMQLKTLYSFQSGSLNFIGSFGKYYDFGIYNNTNTTFYEGSGTSTEQAYSLPGFITDSAYTDKTFAFTGQLPGKPVFLFLASSLKLTSNMTINAKQPGTQLMINGAVYDMPSNGTLQLNNVAIGKYSILAYNPNYDYFYHEYTLNDTNLEINITLNTNENAIIHSYPWEQIGPNRAMVNLNNNTVERAAGHLGKIAFDYSNPRIIFASSGPGMTSEFGPFGDDGIYRTTDGGQTWVSVDFGLPLGSVSSIYMNQSNPNELLAGISQFGVYKTTNGGNYWYRVSHYMNVTDFSSDGPTLYLSSSNGFPGTQGGVIETSDFGNSFSEIAYFPVAVVYVSASQNHIYALLSNNTLYASTNNGQTWIMDWNFQSTPGITPSSIAASPNNPSEVFVTFGSSNGISYGFVSYNGGTTFTRYTNLTQVSKVRFNKYQPNELWIAGGATIYYSSNGGATFLTHPNIWDLHNMAIDPLMEGVAFDIADQGIYETTDYGNSWFSVNGNLENFLSYGVSASTNGQLILSSMQDYSTLASHNGGASWSYGSLTNPVYPTEGSVTYVNHGNSSMVYAYFPGDGQLAVSNNGALDFHTVLALGNGFYGTQQVFAQMPGNPEKVFFGSFDGIYNSTNWGNNWTLWQASPKQILSIAVSSNGTVFASNYSGVYVFTGSKWMTASGVPGGASSISIDFGNPNLVVVSDSLHQYGTAYLSSNGGTHFTPLPISFDPWEGGIWYSEGGSSLLIYFLNTTGYPMVALTNHGAYISENLGVTWYNISYNLISGELTSLTFVNDTLLVSTYGEGIVAMKNFSVQTLPGTLAGHVSSNVSNLEVNGTQITLHDGYYRTYLPPGTYNLTLSGLVNSTLKQVFERIEIKSFSRVYYNYSGNLTAYNYSSKIYDISFIENDLSLGATWSVTLNGSVESSTGSTISFSELNGTYSYSVLGHSNYAVSPMSGSVTVNGKNITVDVKYNRYAHLDLSVSPTSAIVSINGMNETMSSGFLSMYLDQGYYYINASKSGYRPYSDYVYLSYNSNYSYAISLTQVTNAGYLAGTVSPSNATIVANGVIIPVSNRHFNSSLSPGTYYVSFTAGGYNSLVKEINITAGKTSTLDISLAPVTNSITLSGYLTPGNASLVVDGFVAYVNSTGYYHISLSAGAYTISVYESGYYPYSKNITLSSSEVMNFTLVKEPPATSTTSTNDTTATGYNVTVSNLTTGNGVISVSFSSSANGTLIVQIPYADMRNATISEILNSTVYINRVAYSNFTISISSSYTIILKVYGLKSGDPTLSWKYSPDGVVSPPAPTTTVSPALPLLGYEILGAIVALGIVAGVSIAVFGRRRR